MRAFCYETSESAGKPVSAGGEPVVRIVVLSGVEDAFEHLVLLTLSGKVLLRSSDGRKSSRAKPDVFVVDVGAPPIVVVT